MPRFRPRAQVSRPSRLTFLSLLWSVILAPTVRGADPPTASAGELRFSSGRTVRYQVHFDRNSLRDSVRLDDSLIALTNSGALLRFELPAVRLVRERIGAEEVLCLGQGEAGAILACLSDGRVCRVDPATLDLADVAKLPAAPRWISWGRAARGRPQGLVAATRSTKQVERDGERFDLPYSVVHDLATGKRFELEEEATTFLLDHDGRAWLGADKGEWGGWITRVDLATGAVTKVEPPPSRRPGSKAHWQGVYRLSEWRDGQVWAYGGTSHMGFSSGAITRVDSATPQTLYRTPEQPQGKPDPSQPEMPISHVIEEEAGFLVFSYSDVFRVDRALRSWKKVAELKLVYRWGRPDAVGAYPSVRTVCPPRHEGEPYLLATVGDGVVVLKGATASSRALPGQFGASSVGQVENSAEGLLFMEADDRSPTWRLGDSGWSVASLAPPLEPDPDNAAAGFEKQQRGWYSTRVLVGPRGVIYTVCATGVSPGTRTTARCVAGKAERLGRETSSLITSASFVTADGTLWNAFYGALSRFEGGLWKQVARLPLNGPARLQAISANGPPWLLLDHYGDSLWRLVPGANGDEPRLSEIKLREGKMSLVINGAIPWQQGALLLATSAGLRVYSPSTGELSRVDLPEPERPATSLSRDGRGRVWLGGDNGLWLAETGARSDERFDRVPGIGRHAVSALSPDPQHDDGVIVALGARGVVFVRASERVP